MKINLGKKFVLLLVVLVLLSAVFVVYSFKFDSVVGKEEVEMTLIVENSRVIGFDVDDEVLAFGKVPRGSSNTRSLTIKNDYDFPIRVRLIKEGEISEFIQFSNNDFLLEVSESKDVNVIATPSYDAEEKTYTGVLKVFYLK
ncbi:MAG: hypothetical protein ABIB47_02620 [Candidatus Woesearchaeota archaeon]